MGNINYNTGIGSPVTTGYNPIAGGLPTAANPNPAASGPTTSSYGTTGASIPTTGMYYDPSSQTYYNNGQPLGGVSTSYNPMTGAVSQTGSAPNAAGYNQPTQTNTNPTPTMSYTTATTPGGLTQNVPTFSSFMNYQDWIDNSPAVQNSAFQAQQNSIAGAGNSNILTGLTNDQYAATQYGNLYGGGNASLPQNFNPLASGYTGGAPGLVTTTGGNVQPIQNPYIQNGNAPNTVPGASPSTNSPGVTYANNPLQYIYDLITGGGGSPAPNTNGQTTNGQTTNQQQYNVVTTPLGYTSYSPNTLANSSANNSGLAAILSMLLAGNGGLPGLNSISLNGLGGL